MIDADAGFWHAGGTESGSCASPVDPADFGPLDPQLNFIKAGVQTQCNGVYPIQRPRARDADN